MDGDDDFDYELEYAYESAGSGDDGDGEVAPTPAGPKAADVNRVSGGGTSASAPSTVSASTVKRLSVGMRPSSSGARLSLGTPAFVALDADALADELERAVAGFRDLACVTDDEAYLLLHHAKWRAGALQESWWDESRQAALRAAAGAPPPSAAPPRPPPGSQVEDPVQMDSFPVEDCDCGPCGHLFSVATWEEHLRSAVADNLLGALTARCPASADGCTAVVPPSLWHRRCPPEALAKYTQQQLRSFVDTCPSLAHCPGAGCDDVIQCRAASVSELDTKEVTCTKGHAFCFGCKALAHRPASCDELARWTARDETEGGNAAWIMERTKPCPRCKRPIEKNSGCAFMRCGLCAAEFCWNCLAYEKHENFRYGVDDRQSYGAHKCNGRPVEFGVRRGEGVDDFQMFAWYRSQTQSQEASLKAASSLRPVLARLLAASAVTASEPPHKLAFLPAALDALLRGRSVAKHSFVHGFYIGSNAAPAAAESLASSSSSAAAAAAPRPGGGYAALYEWRQNLMAKVGAGGGGVGKALPPAEAASGAGAGAASSSSSAAADVATAAGSAADESSPEAVQLRMFEHAQGELLAQLERLNMAVAEGTVREVLEAEEGRWNDSARASTSAASSSSAAAASGAGAGAASSSLSPSSSAAGGAADDKPGVPTFDTWRANVVSLTGALDRSVSTFVRFVEDCGWHEAALSTTPAPSPTGGGAASAAGDAGDSSSGGGDGSSGGGDDGSVGGGGGVRKKKPRTGGSRG